MGVALGDDFWAGDSDAWGRAEGLKGSDGRPKGLRSGRCPMRATASALRSASLRDCFKLRKPPPRGTSGSDSEAVLLTEPYELYDAADERRLTAVSSLLLVVQARSR